MNPDVGRVGHSRSARCWPRRMNWTRRDSPVSPSAWYCDICLKLRSITLMDLPKTFAVAMISNYPSIAFSALVAVIRSEVVVNLILSGMSPLKVALSMSLYCAISLFICWIAQALNLSASSSSFCQKKSGTDRYAIRVSLCSLKVFMGPNRPTHSRLTCQSHIALSQSVSLII